MEEKKSDGNKQTFDFNEHGLNFMTLSSAIPRHDANPRVVTNGPSSAADLLRSVWVMDSGTTDHMSANPTTFKSYQAFKVAKPIYTGGGTIYAHGQGKIELFAKQQSGSSQKITLHNVLHVPSLIMNLISISALRKKGAY